MMKKCFAMLLAVVLILGCLSGCGGDAQQTPSGSKPGSSSGSSSESQSKYAYQAQYIPLALEGYDVGYITSMAVAGERLFLMANCVTGQEPMVDEITGETYTDENGVEMTMEVFEPLLFVMNLSDNSVEQVAYSVRKPEEGKFGYSYASGLSAMADGTVWFHDQLSTYYYDLPEDFDPETEDGYQYYVDGGMSVQCYHYDGQGNLLETVELELPEGSYLGDFCFTNDGIYATDYGNLYRYNTQGKIEQTLTLDYGMESILPLKDGVAISQWDENGYVVRPVNTETMTLEDPIAMPTNVFNVMAGFGSYDYLYQRNGVFYGLTNGSSEQIMSWLDCDVDYGSISLYHFLDDGTVYAVESSYSDTTGNTYEIVVLRQVDASTLPQKQVLTMACLYLPWDLRTEILNFNRSNSEVRITVTDYSQYATDEDYNAGIQKLNTEILSGMVPDLFCINSDMPMDVYAGKGVLQDLWPLIDSDPELSRDDLMIHFFDVLSSNGKLYQITDTFSIETVVGRSDVIGDGSSWTLEEMLNARSQLEQGASLFGEMDIRETIFDTVISRSIGQFVNWETGQCSFDSQAFMDLLSLVKEFPETFDYDNYDWNNYTSEGQRMRMRMQLAQNITLASMNDVQYNYAMCDGKANFIGYPTTSGNGSSFVSGVGLAISTTCQNTEAAWKFVRQFLTEEFQTSDYMYSFPTNRHAFETYIQNCMTPQYGDNSEYAIAIEDLVSSVAVETVETATAEGEGDEELIQGSYYFSDEDIVNYYHLTQEEYDLFMKLYEGIETVKSSNSSIEAIIMQECEAFYAGQKTVEETAQLIQNRVSLYVAEQG